MQTRLEELRERHDREETQWQEVHDRIEKLSAEVETLCGEAGGVTVDALAKVEEDSRQRQTIERDMTTVEDRLSQLAGDLSLDSFVQQAETEDADHLGARIQQLADDIVQLDGERSTLIARIAVEQQERDRQDGTSRTADADQERERVLAQLRGEVQRYARLRLASAVLNGAMERYRQRHQGPVLGRASQLFGELTCGSFTRLEVDCDDEGEAVLVGVRPGAGNKIGVPGMSDGTRDQLYLALRLASLETWLQEHEPIPFVVDDILIKFDDERATAALKVLAELSRSTQVILFTHHPHIVDLAQRNSRDDVLFVHYLGQTTALAG